MLIFLCNLLRCIIIIYLKVYTNLRLANCAIYRKYVKKWLNVTDSIEKQCKMMYNYVKDLNTFAHYYIVC